MDKVPAYCTKVFLEQVRILFDKPREELLEMIFSSTAVESSDQEKDLPDESRLSYLSIVE